MAMYHMSIKIASRATGRSAVAAAAYRSCSKIENERDGLVHDYTRKHGLVAEGVVLPDCAPERFADRSTLWNEVEAIERSGNAQLAREFEVALPHDLSAWQRVELTLALCHGLASEGMVCDWAIHDADGDNHNVHAHILCPMRSCDENGFLAKAVTAYTVRLDGIEAEMTAAELKDARARGDEWEKVYTYRLGNERRQLAPSEAEEWSGAKRQGKDPVKAKRELNDWNNPENAERWRKGWADLQNGFLAKAESEARVDHRSYARRGVERVAARHEGPYINKIEKEAEARATREGVAYEPVTDRRRENIAIAALNRAMAVMRRRADAVAPAPSTPPATAPPFGSTRRRTRSPRAAPPSSSATNPSPASGQLAPNPVRSRPRSESGSPRSSRSRRKTTSTNCKGGSPRPVCPCGTTLTRPISSSSAMGPR